MKRDPLFDTHKSNTSVGCSVGCAAIVLIIAQVLFLIGLVAFGTWVGASVLQWMGVL